MTQKYAGQQYETNQVHFVRKNITFADIGTTISVGWVPPKATMIRGGVHITTAFDAGAKTLDDVRRHYEQMVPMQRGCRAGDVMEAIYYLMAQQYETGQALPVTGGQVMLH